ncbi:MAG: endonuclease III [SAR324 cluster bacterium]|nr:endonuclease III [SAR324 cluster bacterium]
MRAAEREQFFQNLSKAIPEPITELQHANTFELLIAIILSAQTTDAAVNKVTPSLFGSYPTPQKLAQAEPEEVLIHIKTIGLAPTKAKNIVKTAQQLCEQHQGEIPEDPEALQALPGVGRKTANVLLNTAFGHPVIAVDTHVFRVSNRTGLARGKTVEEVERKLARNVPPNWRKDAHHYLILQGRYTCKARKPLCGQCPVFKECSFPGKEIEKVS